MRRIPWVPAKVRPLGLDALCSPFCSCGITRSNRVDPGGLQLRKRLDNSCIMHAVFLLPLAHGCHPCPVIGIGWHIDRIGGGNVLRASWKRSFRPSNRDGTVSRHAAKALRSSCIFRKHIRSWYSCVISRSFTMGASKNFSHASRRSAYRVLVSSHSASMSSSLGRRSTWSPSVGSSAMFWASVQSFNSDQLLNSFSFCLERCSALGVTLILKMTKMASMLYTERTLQLNRCKKRFIWGCSGPVRG